VNNRLSQYKTLRVACEGQEHLLQKQQCRSLCQQLLLLVKAAAGLVVRFRTCISAHCTNMDNTQAPAHNVGKPWSLPADFLPVPEGYGPAEPTVVNLKDFNHNQLVQLAVEYNKANGVEDDPFERVLKGIPERAQLRPGSKEPVSHYMGLQGLPPHGKYAKAWKKLIRGSRQLMEDETGPIAKVRIAAGHWYARVVAVVKEQSSLCWLVWASLCPSILQKV
jgi:hypothetical protein